jgi:iron only hydrogenase large subunit-like protein
VVKASLANCLACSGCVTKEETVLLEEQLPVDVLKRRMASLCSTNDDDFIDDRMMVVTISPASWANLVRHLGCSPLTGNSSTLTWQQQFTSLLHNILAVQYVLDGTVPLQWSLQQAAQDFCQAYQDKQQRRDGDDDWTLQQKLTPSTALSSRRTQYMLPNGQVKTHTNTPCQLLPLISSRVDRFQLKPDQSSTGL